MACTSHSCTALFLSPCPSQPPYACLSSPELFINDHLRIIKAQHNHSSDYHVCTRGWGLRESSDPIGVVSCRPCALRKIGQKSWVLPFPGTASIHLPITKHVLSLSVDQSIEWMRNGRIICPYNELITEEACCCTSTNEWEEGDHSQLYYPLLSFTYSNMGPITYYIIYNWPLKAIGYPLLPISNNLNPTVIPLTHTGPLFSRKSVAGKKH